MITDKDIESIKNIQIDDEFKALCPNLTYEELDQLRENILSDGEFREPLIVWNQTLIDGHNRLEVWHNITNEQRQRVAPPRIKLMDFSSHDEASDWIINNQTGRRNLAPSQRAYLVGKLYQAEKKNTSVQADEPATPNPAIGHNVQKLSTADRIGKEHGISGKQVRRDAKFSKAVDELAKNIGPHTKTEMLNTPALSKKKIVELGSLPADQQKEAYEREMGRGKPLPEPIKPQFDDKKFESDIGKVIRGVYHRFDILGGIHHRNECERHLRAFYDALQRWRAENNTSEN